MSIAKGYNPQDRLFSTPATHTPRKRKALPASEVTAAVIKSSPVPMSNLEATDSLKLLTTLCPFFLRQFEVGGQDWFETPPTASNLESCEDSDIDHSSSPTKASHRLIPPPSPGSKLFGGVSIPPSSPGSKAKVDSAQEIHTRSPLRVKREAGGLRQVREIIRRELDLQE